MRKKPRPKAPSVHRLRVLETRILLEREGLDKLVHELWNMVHVLDSSTRRMELVSRGFEYLRPAAEAQRVIDGLVPMVRELVDSVPEHDEPDIFKLARRIGDHLGMD